MGVRKLVVSTQFLLAILRGGKGQFESSGIPSDLEVRAVRLDPAKDTIELAVTSCTFDGVDEISSWDVMEPWQPRFTRADPIYLRREDGRHDPAPAGAPPGAGRTD